MLSLTCRLSSTASLLLILLPVTTFACGSFHAIGDPYLKSPLVKYSANDTSHRISNAITCNNGNPSDTVPSTEACSSPSCWLATDDGLFYVNGTVNYTLQSIDRYEKLFSTIRASESFNSSANDFQRRVLAHPPTNATGYCLANGQSGYNTMFNIGWCIDGQVYSCDDSDAPLGDGLVVQVCTPWWDGSTKTYYGSAELAYTTAEAVANLTAAPPNYTTSAATRAGDMLGLSTGTGGSWIVAVLLVSFMMI